MKEDKTIIEILQNEVDKVTEEEWKDDKFHPPVFFVSVTNESEKNQKILLTCSHCNSVVTRTLFPIENKDIIFGYESLRQYMIYLYNTTI